MIEIKKTRDVIDFINHEKKRCFSLYEGKVSAVQILDLMNFLKDCVNEEMGGIFVRDELAELKEKKEGIIFESPPNFDIEKVLKIKPILEGRIIKYDIKNNRFEV